MPQSFLGMPFTKIVARTSRGAGTHGSKERAAIGDTVRTRADGLPGFLDPP
jgi:hypothetical protein